MTSDQESDVENNLLSLTTGLELDPFIALFYWN